MSAGYSKRTLAQKLGLKPEMRAAILNAPAGYDATLTNLPQGIQPDTTVNGTYDFIQVFVEQRADLESSFPLLKSALAHDGALWVSWRKGGHKTGTDLNENVVREVGLSAGLVDVKVIAVDETWSGLKFVYRLMDRT
jgi:hypothetical protein